MWSDDFTGQIFGGCHNDPMKFDGLGRSGRMCAVVAVFALGFGSRLRGQAFSQTHVDEFSGHPRVIVLSDIGNEPDDQMSLIRLLLYSNELDVEALIAATST